VVALVLLVIFAAINLMGIKWLSRSNTWITSLKVFVRSSPSSCFSPPLSRQQLLSPGGFFLKGPTSP